MLHFCERSRIFAEKTEIAMKTIETDFRTFVRFLEDTPVRPDFPAVCRQLHICPGALDDYLVRELGLCGEELLLQI